MNRSAKGLSIVTTNLDGFSLVNRRQFAKLSPRQTFPLYGNQCQHTIFLTICAFHLVSRDHFLRPLDGVQNPFMEEIEDQIISYAKCSITLVPSYNALITTACMDYTYIHSGSLQYHNVHDIKMHFITQIWDIYVLPL